MTRIRLPHSEIPGSKLALSSPRLIAEFYVLHRYWLSRHPLLVPLFTFLCIDLTSNRRLITNSRIYFRNQEGISFIYTNASLYLIFIVVQIVNSTCDLNKSYILRILAVSLFRSGHFWLAELGIYLISNFEFMQVFFRTFLKIFDFS